MISAHRWNTVPGTAKKWNSWCELPHMSKEPGLNLSGMHVYLMIRFRDVIKSIIPLTTKIRTAVRSDSPSARNHCAPICTLACFQPRRPMLWKMGNMADTPRMAKTLPRRVRHLGDRCAPMIRVLAAAMAEARVCASRLVSNRYRWFFSTYNCPVYSLELGIAVKGVVGCRYAATKRQNADAENVHPTPEVVNVVRVTPQCMEGGTCSKAGGRRGKERPKCKAIAYVCRWRMIWLVNISEQRKTSRNKERWP